MRPLVGPGRHALQTGSPVGRCVSGSPRLALPRRLRRQRRPWRQRPPHAPRWLWRPPSACLMRDAISFNQWQSEVQSEVQSLRMQSACLLRRASLQSVAISGNQRCNHCACKVLAFADVLHGCLKLLLLFWTDVHVRPHVELIISRAARLIAHLWGRGGVVVSTCMQGRGS